MKIKEKIKEKMIELFASDYGPLMRNDDCLGQVVREAQDRSELFYHSASANRSIIF